MVQAPATEQLWPEGQVPQVPPQPSLPHCLPPQVGRQVQVPAVEQTVEPVQAPQPPPQPSGPQVFPAQLGVQVQVPVAEQVSPEGQVPQVPPQPSGPHCFPTHWGMQRHAPAWQTSCALGQVPQKPPQPSGVQAGVLAVQTLVQLQTPASPQELVDRHEPQTPPQPSEPHCLALHVGRHWHRPLEQTSWAPGQVPQDRPQALVPQTALPQVATHWQVPASQTSTGEHVPQPFAPPQLSTPQVAAPQVGWQTHSPSTLHWSPPVQAPVPPSTLHSPPQPSSPQTLGPPLGRAQLGVQVHRRSALHDRPLAHPCPPSAPQKPPQPSLPHWAPTQLGVQRVMPQCPVGSQLPPSQAPQEPPQPSSPQTRPAQLGVQAWARSESRYCARRSFSHCASGRAGGMVPRVMARRRIASALRRTSASVSTSMPRVAPWRASAVVSVEEWHERHCCSTTARPEGGQCASLSVPGPRQEPRAANSETSPSQRGRESGGVMTRLVEKRPGGQTVRSGGDLCTQQSTRYSPLPS